MNVIYLKRKAQILWKINPSHLPTHPPRVDHLGATHMEIPFPIEPGRCPVPFFFFMQRHLGCSPQEVLGSPQDHSGISPSSSAHESDNRLEPVFREAGSGEHPACVESEDQGSLTAFLHTGHTVGIPVGPAACPAPGHHKAPPTSDLPSAAVSDRCPALYCRW